MSSFLLLSFTTLLVLILDLVPFTTSFLVDIDRDKIRNGGLYFIVVSPSGKGLTYTQVNGECPFYITSETEEISLGTPVKINNLLRKTYLNIGDHVTLGFVDLIGTKLPCKGSLKWKSTQNSTSKKTYITTGGGSILTELSFVITKRDKSFSPTFELQYCDYKTEEGVCSNVGLFENGILGTTQHPSTISFHKAFSVPELSTF